MLPLYQLLDHFIALWCWAGIAHVLCELFTGRKKTQTVTNTLKALLGWVLADSRPQFVVWPLNARNDGYIALKRLSRLIYSCMRQLVFHYWPEVGNDKDLQRACKDLHTHVHTLSFPLPFISRFIYPSLILSFPPFFFFSLSLFLYHIFLSPYSLPHPPPHQSF